MNVVKLRPKAHAESITSAIPTISPEAIVPFLTEPLAVGRSELDRAGYVTIGLDDRRALGDGSQFYARGLKNSGTEYYQIFRQGAALKHPDTGEIWPTRPCSGDARLLESGDPAKLMVTRSSRRFCPRTDCFRRRRRPRFPIISRARRKRTWMAYPRGS